MSSSRDQLIIQRTNLNAEGHCFESQMLYNHHSRGNIKC